METVTSDRRDPVLFSEFSTGHSIQDAYHRPAINRTYEGANNIGFWWDFPWNWGNEGQENEEEPTTPGDPSKEFLRTKKANWTDFLGTLLFIGAAIVVVKWVL